MGCVENYPAFLSSGSRIAQTDSSMPGRSTLLATILSCAPAILRSFATACSGVRRKQFRRQRQTTILLSTADHLQIGGVGLSYVEYIGDVSVGFGEVSFVRQCFSIEGAARYTTGRRSAGIAPGSWTPILHARQPLQFDFQSGYRQIALRIEFDALLRNLGALLGQDVRRFVVRRNPGKSAGDGSAAAADFSSGHRLQ